MFAVYLKGLSLGKGVQKADWSNLGGSWAKTKQNKTTANEKVLRSYRWKNYWRDLIKFSFVKKELKPGRLLQISSMILRVKRVL